MKTVRNMVVLCVAMVAVSGIWMGKAGPLPAAETTGCTKAEGAAILTIVTNTGECVAPIVFQGLLSGQPAATIVDAALSCGGATAEGVLAYVESLIAGGGEAGAEAGVASMSPEMQQRVAALHFELLNRVAAKKAAK
jgi:hypothetical protein